jgi:hypothetical protein
MMNCKEIENFLPLYPDDLLSAAEKQAVEEHLKSCPKCCKEMALLQKTEKMAHDLKEVEPPPWFKQRIMAQVREEADKKSFVQKWFYPLRIKIPVQIAATIVITVLAVYIYRTGEQEMKAVLPRTVPMIEVQKEMQKAPAEEPKEKENVLPAQRIKKKVGPSGDGSDKKAVMYDVSPGIPAQLPKMEEKNILPESKRASEDYAADPKKDAALDKAHESSGGILSARQEMPAKSMPAPAMQPQYDREDQGFVSKSKQYKAAAPRAAKSMAATGASGQTTIVLYVKDINVAATDVEKLLGKFEAKNIVKKLSASKTTITMEFNSQKLKDLIAQLKTIGEVDGKGMSDAVSLQVVSITIEIVNN